MKAIIVVLMAIIFSADVVWGMRRVVTTDRVYTGLNEIYLLGGSQVSFEDFSARYPAATFKRSELR